MGRRNCHHAEHAEEFSAGVDVKQRQRPTKPPAPELVARVVAQFSAGISLSNLRVQLRTTNRNVQSATSKALEAGLIVRCGGGARNYVYASHGHAHAINARIAEGEELREKRRASKRRMEMRKILLEQDLDDIRRVIVRADTLQPPHTIGHRSVWDFAAA